MFGKEKELLASKRKKEIVIFKDSVIYKKVVERINEKIKAKQIITDENIDEKQIFRAQGAIKMAKSILAIPDKLEKESTP